MAGAPKRHGDEGLVQRPAHCQLKDMLAEILFRKTVKPLHRFQVLRVAGLLKFWVDLTDVVTGKLSVEFIFPLSSPRQSEPYVNVLMSWLRQ